MGQGQEELTVYDETINRMASKLGLTVDEVHDIMEMYMDESRQVKIDRGYIRTGFEVASKSRTKRN